MATKKGKKRLAFDNVAEKNLKLTAATSPCHFVPTGTGSALGLWHPGKPLLSANPPSDLGEKLKFSKDDYRSLFLVTLVAICARFYDLRNPPNVVYEEAALGGFVNRYMFGNFFLDIEPPLPGILYYLLAYLEGYKDTSQFYGRNESYIGTPFQYYLLRSCVASFGCLSVILTFCTLKLSGVSRMSAVVGAAFVIFDNSLATEFRYILPNPLFLSTASLSTFLWKKMETQRLFSIPWLTFLLSLSISLGVSVSL